MNRLVPGLLAAAMCAHLSAGPVSESAIGGLPAGVQAKWKAYFERSQAAAAADQAALRDELAAAGLAAAVKAPSGGDFKLSAKPGQPWFASPDAGALADIVLSYQTPAGGWSKRSGYSKGPRQPGTLWSSQYDPGKSPHYLGTFDNRATTEQLRFLAGVWQATGREDCKAAVAKGLDYIFAAQFPNGGWPQVWPLEGGYHDNITFNDDAMTHVLSLLHSVAGGDAGFDFLDQAARDKAAAALEKGLDCVLRMQIVRDGVKTAWCAQHDPFTLEPVAARAMEPAALSGQESANLLKYLMTLPDPSPELVAGIESGLAWLEKVKITGLARVKRDGKTTYEPDPSSTEVYWARFYDPADDRPVFPGRDGVLYKSFNEMAANNALGYDFYTTRPGSILTNGRKKWLKMRAVPAGG